MNFLPSLVLLFVTVVPANAALTVRVRPAQGGPILTGKKLGRGPSFALPMEVGEVRVLEY